MKKQVLCLLIVVLVAAGSAFAIWQERQTAEAGQLAYIYSDEKLVRTVDLSGDVGLRLRVDSPDGGYNIVEVHDGAIGVTEADCADGVCMHTGFIRSSKLPVVCMPHKLVIRVGNPSENGVDTVAK